VLRFRARNGPYSGLHYFTRSCASLAHLHLWGPSALARNNLSLDRNGFCTPPVTSESKPPMLSVYWYSCASCICFTRLLSFPPFQIRNLRIFPFLLLPPFLSFLSRSHRLAKFGSILPSRFLLCDSSEAFPRTALSPLGGALSPLGGARLRKPFPRTFLSPLGGALSPLGGARLRKPFPRTFLSSETVFFALFLFFFSFSAGICTSPRVHNARD